MSPRADLHVVLVWPEIPWNTGNVARSCLAFGAELHLVEPVGFSLDASAVKRAGLDYWEHVRLTVHRDLDALVARLPELGTPWLLTADAERSLYDAPLAPPAVLRARQRDRCLRIPQAQGVVRSLNLSTAAAIAMAEFRRRFPRA